MYKPGRPRPRLTSITRTRSGCMTCRRRKKRCDEAVPRCSACARLGLDCVPASTDIKFSTERSLVGPPPPVSVVSWESRPHSLPATPSSTCHVSSSLTFEESPRNSSNISTQTALSPVVEELSPLLTPAPSNSQSQTSPTSSDVHQDHITATSSSTRDEEGESQGWAFMNCSHLLDGDWASPPWLYQDEVIPNETTPAQIRHSLNRHVRPQAETWFTAPSAEPETNEEPATSRPNPGYSANGMDDAFRKLYTNHWENTVLDILPPVFRRLSLIAGRCAALQSGILALSAAHIGHIQVQIRVKFGTEDEYYAGPNHGHLVQMRQFYNHALRQLSNLIIEGSRDSILILGCLLILMLVERTVGSFKGEAFHESGIEKLLSDNFSVCTDDLLGSDLIRAWLILRAENWSHRIPFTVLSYSKALKDMGIDFVAILARDSILPIMLESWHLSTMILFEQFVDRGDMESISSRCYRFYHGLVEENHLTRPWRSVEHPPDEDYQEQLLQLSCALDEWHAGLIVDNRPIESFGLHRDFKQSKFLSPSSDPRLFSLRPLLFRSHQAAMNYLFYLCSQLLQSPKSIHPWKSGSTDSHRYEDEPNWMMLLLRVALGLDPKTCFEENIFSIGLSDLIMIALLRCPPVPQSNGRYDTTSSSLLVSFAKSIASTFEARSIFREGHCSLELFSDFVRLIDRMLREDKSIFFTITGDADTAWTKLYGHGMGSVVVLGRNSHTQKLFGEKVTVKAKYVD